MGFPDPFDLMTLVSEMGYIVNFVARLDDRLQVCGAVEAPRVDHHGPLLGGHCLGAFVELHLRPVSFCSGAMALIAG